MFKKITDERLILKNLKNIRVAYVVQTVGILAILIYEGFNKGVSAVSASPLWLVFMGTALLLIYLNLGISVDNDETIYEKKQGPYFNLLLTCFVVSLIFGGAFVLASNSSLGQGIIFGAAIFISLLLPYSITYYLKKKRNEESE